MLRVKFGYTKRGRSMSEAAAKIVAEILDRCSALTETAKTAETHRKSLDGDAYYGNRFHDELVEFASVEAKIRPLIKSLDLSPEHISDFEECLDAITSTSRLGKKRNEALRKLRMFCSGVLLPALDAGLAPPSPVGEPVLPKAVVIPSKRNHLINVVIQANACYESRCYDAASVMIRKLIEMLIIEAYEANGKAGDIQNGAGDFLMLSDLIQKTLSDSSWHLGRETKVALPKLKSLGDRAAHNRRFLATKADVDGVTSGLRVAVDDLLHLAKLK